MEAFWSFSPLTLDEIGERLGEEFQTSDPEFDAENLYEWFEVTAASGLRLNVSRKHRAGKPDFEDPLRISASGYQSVDDLGRRLAACLRTTVYYGKVTYLEGDDFRYSEAARFEPGA